MKAPFINSYKIGIVVGLEKSSPNFETKTILEVLEHKILIPSYALMIRDKIAVYYGCSINEALYLFSFTTTSKKKKSVKPILANLTHKIETIQTLTLNPEQEKIAQDIWENCTYGKEFTASLIHGITGSGKTEIYQKLIQLSISDGKQALLLLPEIAITTQIFERLKRTFGDHSIVFIHSRMTPAQKEKSLLEIQLGLKQIIVGPRSALFSSFQNLGCIIMDEEHDASYKSQESPRYHTRRVAMWIAQYLKIPFILGSATPSLETFYAVQQNYIQYYALKKRFYDTPLPEISIVDMSQETHFFSEPLMKNLVTTYKKGKQTLLFLNRRGFAPTLLCTACQHIFYCPNCSIVLTYHKQIEKLQCHYCDYQEYRPNRCPTCQKPRTLKTRGMGTERIEEEIKNLFHSYRILRMDKDSTKKYTDYQTIIESFTKGEADILIGTQMLTKGLDFPHLELVGILSCDFALNLPDFRANEHVYTLITQVAGRAGRQTKGKVILQTRFPNNYAIQAAIQNDYEKFYNQEIHLRREYQYPPFCKFIRILVRSPKREKASQMIQSLFEIIQKQYPNIEIMGPSACVLEKLHRQYRFHLIIKSQESKKYMPYIRELIIEWNQKKSNYHLELDVDPINLL